MQSPPDRHLPRHKTVHEVIREPGRFQLLYVMMVCICDPCSIVLHLRSMHTYSFRILCSLVRMVHVKMQYSLSSSAS